LLTIAIVLASIFIDAWLREALVIIAYVIECQVAELSPTTI